MPVSMLSTLTPIALVVVLGWAWQGKAQGSEPQYLRMAPLEQYLMADQNAEIALAQTAAPKSISRDARSWFLDAMVTKPRSKARTVSYVWWIEGGRPRSTTQVFLNPALREPVCYNPAAALCLNLARCAT